MVVGRVRKHVRLGRSAALLLAAALFAGCATTAPLQPDIRAAAMPVDFPDLMANPERFRGETVILGGEIIDAVPTANGTRLNVLQTRTDAAERPGSSDTSQGRFVAMYQGFLDPAIYATGRQVTVAGTVAGAQAQTVGNTQQTQPLINAQQVYLWPQPQPRYYYAPGPYYYYPFYNPFWPYEPFYEPYYEPFFSGPIIVGPRGERHEEREEHEHRGGERHGEVHEEMHERAAPEFRGGAAPHGGKR